MGLLLSPNELFAVGERRLTLMRKKILAAVSMILVFSFLFVFAGCSSTEDEETTTTTVNVKTPLPTDITTSYDEESQLITDTTYSPEALAANTATIFEYFNLHVNEIKSEKAQVEMSRKRSIGKSKDADDNGIPYSDNEYINAAITTLDSYMLPKQSDSVEYGESLVDFMPVHGAKYVSALTLDEIESATCVDDGLLRTITVTLKKGSLPSTLEKAYDLGDVDEIMAEFAKAEKYLSIEKPTLTYDECQIIITANRETDDVTAIEYVKVVDVKTNVTGTGSLADMGTVPVCLRYTDTVKYTLERTDPNAETTVANS